MINQQIAKQIINTLTANDVDVIKRFLDKLYKITINVIQTADVLRGDVYDIIIEEQDVILDFLFMLYARVIDVDDMNKLITRITEIGNLRNFMGDTLHDELVICENLTVLEKTIIYLRYYELDVINIFKD